MENQQSLTVPMQHKPESSLGMEYKISQITAMTRQCFDCLDTYGKTPEQLETLMMAMIDDLSPYELPMIENAFLTWRKTQEKVPTSAGIIKLIEANLRQKNRMAALSEPNPVIEDQSDWKDLTAEQRKELDDWTAKILANLRGGQEASAQPATDVSTDAQAD